MPYFETTVLNHSYTSGSNPNIPSSTPLQPMMISSFPDTSSTGCPGCGQFHKLPEAEPMFYAFVISPTVKLIILSVFKNFVGREQWKALCSQIFLHTTSPTTNQWP